MTPPALICPMRTHCSFNVLSSPYCPSNLPGRARQFARLPFWAELKVYKHVLFYFYNSRAYSLQPARDAFVRGVQANCASSLRYVDPMSSTRVGLLLSQRGSLWAFLAMKCRHTCRLNPWGNLIFWTELWVMDKQGTKRATEVPALAPVPDTCSPRRERSKQCPRRLAGWRNSYTHKEKSKEADAKHTMYK
jgi:hypothetical protein